MPSSREIKNQNDGLNEQRDILEEISSLMEDASKASEDLTKSLSGVADLFGQIRDDSQEIPDNIDDTNTSTNKFNTLLKQAQGKTKDLAKGLVSAGKQVANTMTSALGEIGDILSNVVSLSVVGTFGAIFGAVVSKFQADFKSVVNELGYGFAAANGELSNLNKTFEGMVERAELVGLSAKDLVSSSRELSDNFGIAMSEAAQLSFDISDGAKALGVQSSTMATLVGQFSTLTDLSAQQSHELSEHIGILAAQNDVAPQAVLQDIAQSTEDIAIFSKGGVKNFAATAIEARKLGMSVKDVANSLKGMLDFESSLNAELEASVMLGKNINLNEARRLAFAGDTQGAFEAIADSLSGVDLGSLDPLTLQSVAKAAGMSVDQLMKMAKGADEMGGVDMGEEAMTAQERAALESARTMSRMEKLLARMSRAAKKLADAFGDDLVGALESLATFLERLFDPEERKKMMDEMVDYFKKIDWVGIGKNIGQMLITGLTAFLLAAGGMLFGIGKALGDSILGGLLKGVGAFEFLFPAKFAKMAKKITDIYKGMRIAWLKNVVRPIMRATRPFRKFGKSVSKSLGGVTKVFKMIGKGIKMVTKPIRMLLKPFTAIFKVVSSILKPFGSLVKSFGRLGLKGIPILGQILTFIDGIFGGFANVDSSLTGVTGAFKNMYRFITGFIFGAIEGIVTAFTGVFDYIFGTDLTGWFKDAFDFITDGFNTVTDGIVDFFSDIPGNIAAIFSNLGTLILDVIKGAGSLGTSILNWALEGLSNLGQSILDVVNIGANFFSDMFSGAIEGVKKVPGMIADAFLGIGDLVAGAVSGAFDKIGAMFSSIGETLLNLLPDIDFGEFAGNFADSVKSALSTVTNFIKKPFNFIIRTFNKIKNAISGKVLFKGYTLLSKGRIADNSVFGKIPPFDIAIPKIKTPTLMGDVPELQTGGTVTKTGIAKVDEGEVVSGVRGEALKPVADEIAKLKQDTMETNLLLRRILSEGIPVMKA